VVDILHKVGVTSSTPDEVYAALTTLDGLSGWWTENTDGGTAVGDVVHFRFQPGDIDMTVGELDPGRHVLWQVTDGPREWIGTTVNWELGRTARAPPFCSHIMGGASRWSSCTTAAPSGRSSC